MSAYTKHQTRNLLVFLLCTLLLAGWLWWGNKALETTYYRVQSASLPREFEGYRIAQVSDLHNAEFGEGNSTLIEALRAQKPDLIAVTGDLVDSHRTNRTLALDFVEQAAQIAPVFYVTGNHEAGLGSQLEVFLADLEDAGAQVLRSRAVEVERAGAVLTVAGVDDPAVDSRTSQLAGLAGVADDGFTLLLAHRPELFSAYASESFELVLSGHAHGGQVRLPLLGGVFAPHQGWWPEFDAGLVTQGETSMVVSRGLGNSLIPLRVNNRPELVIVTLASS